MARVSAELDAAAAAAAGLAARLSGRQIALTPQRDRVGLRPEGTAATVWVRRGDWDVACAEWAAGSAHLEQRGLVADRSALAVLVSAAAAHRVVRALRAGAAAQEATLHVRPLVALAWSSTRGADGRRRPWCFRGFIECADGSIASLALSDDRERELTMRALAIEQWPPRAPLDAGAWQACRELQLWGIAAIPAYESMSASASSQPESEVPSSQLGKVGDWLPAGKEAAGLRALVVGNLVAAPFAGLLLQAAGAEILHIHHPLRPPLRFGRLPITRAEPLDIGGPAGAARLQTLLAENHCLLENLRPRVLANLGPLQALSDIRSHVSLPGFAASTPTGNWRSLGFQLEALTGCGVRPLQPRAFEIKGPVPLVSDYCAAFVGAAASLLTPQRIELPQSALLSELAAGYQRALSSMSHVIR